MYVADSQYDQAKQNEDEEQCALAENYRNEVIRLGESILTGCTDDLFAMMPLNFFATPTRTPETRKKP